MAEDFDFSKINASSEKLAKTHESTIKHLIKSSQNERSKAEIVKNHIKLLKEELKINKDSFENPTYNKRFPEYDNEYNAVMIINNKLQ